MTDSLYDHYERRAQEGTPITKEQARASIKEIIGLFQGWDEDRMGALLLDVGMILAMKRGRKGVDVLVEALESIDALTTRFDEQYQARHN